MKKRKLFSATWITLFAALFLGTVLAQSKEPAGAGTEAPQEQVAAQTSTPEQIQETTATPQPADNAAESRQIIEENGQKYTIDESLHAQIKTKFIEGDPIFMAPVLLTLILGLALAIERLIYLNLSSSNSKKLLKNVEHALATGGIEAAKEVCRNTSGPVASIFYQGLDRADEGVDVVEKSVIAYGGVQAGLLEKNLSWISLFIALAPMLGFMGTVIGMISAFDAIEAAGDISATVVAGGIKIALLTTVAGLVAAIILQIFYNAILAKIDDIVNSMEDASISLVDLIVRHNKR